MAWTSVSPIGSKSVKDNRTTMAANTLYIETTMGNVAQLSANATTPDHFWNISSTLDGHHRYVRYPKYETALNTPGDPAVGTGMSGVHYLRLVNSAVGKVELFYKNANAVSGEYPGVYQVTPTYRSGTLVINVAFSDLSTPLPANVYGEIFFYIDGVVGNGSVSTAIFHTNAATMTVIGVGTSNTSSDASSNLIFSATGLQMRVGVGQSAAGSTWTYKITYRAK